MPHRDCLTEAELSAYQLGEMSEEQQIEAAEHFRDCPHCAAELARLDGLTDGVIAALRQYPPSAVVDQRLAGLQVQANGLMDTSPLTARLIPPTEAPRSLPGYEVMDEIGRGGMGVVYRARQIRLNRIVALKMVLAGNHARHAELTRFLVEAEMVGRLHHPNIVQIHEVGTHENKPFIALEYVSGGTLADRLNGQPWPAQQAAILLEKLAQATDHAHRQGIVHRDLKPANILLSPDGSPKITDFGLAKLVEAGAGSTTTGAILGTPAYMAPEQAEGNGRRVGPCSDIFSLGVILYELLAGRPPFRGDTPMDILLSVATREPLPLSRARPGLPRDLCTICQRCLEKDPQRRYATAGALAEDLGHFLAGEPIRARRVGELERVWKWAQRRPAVAALLLAVTFLLVGWAGTSTFLWVDARNSESRANYNAQTAREAGSVALRKAKEAKEAEAKAVAARLETESSLGRTTFREGVAAAQAGQLDQGLHFMLRALRSAPNDQKLQHVVRASMAAYAEQLPVLRRIWTDQGPRGWFLEPDGAVFVTATLDNRLQHWDTQTCEKMGAPTQPLGGQVRDLSGDGRWALILTEVNKRYDLLLRDTSTMAPGKSLGVPFDSYTLAGFSPCGKIVWVTQADDSDGNVKDTSKLFKVPSDKPTGSEFCHDFRLLRSGGQTILMSFPHPNGTDLAASATFKVLLDTEPVAIPRWESDHIVGSRWVQFDGKSIVTLGRDGLVRWWSPITGKQTRNPWRPTRISREDPGILLAGGRTLVMLRSDGRLGWFDLASCQELPLSLPSPRRLHLAVRADGTDLLLGSEGQPTRLWRLAYLPLPAGQLESDRKYHNVAFSPDGETIYQGTPGICKNPYGLLTRTATSQPIGYVSFPAIYGPVFSPDGKRLASHSPAVRDLKSVQIRDITSGQCSDFECHDLIHGLAFSPDSRVLAAGFVKGIRLEFLGQKSSLELVQSAPISELLFSSDGRWLATGSRAGWSGAESCLRVWEVTTQPVPKVRPVGEAQRMSDAPRLAFSPDNRVLYTLELAPTRLRRWEVGATLKELGSQLLGSDTESVQAVFSKDRRRLLTGYRDGRVRQWDTETGEAVGEPMSHSSPVTCLAFSPDGLHIAIGCEDGNAWLRDAATGLAIGPPTIGRAAVKALSFGTDGTTLRGASASGSTSIRQVPAPIGQSVEDLEAWLRTGTGTRLDGEGVVLLDANDWNDSRRRLVERWPQAADKWMRPASLVRWHAARAADAEPDGIGYRWELNRLLQLEGDATAQNWLTRARKAHLFAQEARLDQAQAEYKTIESVAKDFLPMWCQKCAVDARSKGEWSLAHWYLDRVLPTRPNDWHLYEQRAAVRAAMGPERSNDARADQLRASDLGADHLFLLGLVDQLAAEHDWKEARKQLQRAFQRSNGCAETCQRCAVVHLYLGEKDLYLSRCDSAWKCFEAEWRKKPPTIDFASDASTLGWLCTLSPDVVARPDAARRLDRLTLMLVNSLPRIENLLAKQHKTSDSAMRLYAVLRYQILYARAAFLYRAGGRDEEALQLLRETDGLDRKARNIVAGIDAGTTGWHRPLMMLLSKRLGQTSQAQKWREETQKWLRANPVNNRNWLDWLTVKILVRED